MNQDLNRLLEISNLLGYGQAKSSFTHIKDTPTKNNLEQELNSLKSKLISQLEDAKIVSETMEDLGRVHAQRDQYKSVIDEIKELSETQPFPPIENGQIHKIISKLENNI